MFRQRNMLCTVTARDGQKVLVRARIGLYEPRGEFQLIVDHLEDAGLGALQRQFEELRTRLAAEGLFSAGRKRPLPALPRRIGVITSPTGAAVHDILHVLARRFPAVGVLIYPVAVQGTQAAAEIVAALKTAAARLECDVLILARGGGSLEDLWAFNDEKLARAIVASPIPVVSGVGHEVDFTIADFAADVRAPTPSAAAELVVPDAVEWLEANARLGGRLQRSMRRHVSDHLERLRWLTGRAAQVSPLARLAQQTQRLDELDQRMSRAVQRRLHGHRERLLWLRGRAALVSPSARLAQHLRRLGDLEQRLGRATRQLCVHTLTARREALAARLEAAGLDALRRARERLMPLVRTLNAVSPLATLGRGYAIVVGGQGNILRDAADAADGELIEARLAVGTIRAKVQRP